MKNLSLNLLSNVENQGRGRSSNQPNGNNGQGNGGRKWRNMPTCYNYAEIGHISPLCNKAKRMGGDMYPLPTQLPNRANDFAIEIKGDKAGPSQRFTAEEKGKTKVLNIGGLEKIGESEEPVVILIGKNNG